MNLIKVTGFYDNEEIYINPLYIQYLVSKAVKGAKVNTIHLKDGANIYIKENIKNLIKTKEDNFYLWNSFYG